MAHLDGPGSGREAPESLRYRRRMNARTRTVLHLLAATGSIGIAGLVAWAWLSPQIRLDTALTLTVFLVPWVVIGGPYLMHLAASARSERHAQELWRDHGRRARRFAGTVTDRDVRTTDEGQVSLFRVRVTGLPAAVFPGGEVAAAWRPFPRAGDYLLQSQVPGAGAPARVWRVPGLPDSPVVVELTDPTVVTPAPGGGEVVHGGD
ncbi:hypothetical protein GCM10011333_08530 [Sediminivirga luteola]|uniref:Uncharacterized protein n=1 Tax=Sediminivirga luteola TaxID=1774748 RepID=A0A8J2XJN5_9MICO|nr:hypothetical protein GCM10011333_08530 [Sediminivirga luteola]